MGNAKNATHRRFIRALASILTLFALLTPFCGARRVHASDGGGEYGGEIEETLASLTSASGADSVGGWVRTLGAGDEWYVLAIFRYDPTFDLSDYGRSALAAVGDALPGAVERQRYALALYAAGYGGNGFVTSTPSETVGEGGVMSLVFGLHLANNNIVGDESADGVIDRLLSARGGDGGWSVRSGASDVDVTAMAITALAPHISDRADVKDAVDGAFALLSSRQKESGGFSSYGVENAESAAQVMIALASVGRDPSSDTEFVKNGHSVADALAAYRLPDGTYSHTAGGGTNKTATAQALTALIACRLRSDGELFYVFDSPAAPPITDAPDTDSGADTSPPSAATAPSTDTDADTGTNTGTDTHHFPFRIIRIAAASAVAAVGICVTVVFIVRKRRPFDIAAVIAVTVVLAALILTVKIQSPDEYFSGTGEISDTVGTVSVSVVCPVSGKDSVIAPVSVGIAEGGAVLDALTEAARRAGILIELDAAGTYVRGIDGIREFDHGDLSGWKYSVNGEFPSVGCAEYRLSPGDVVVWEYVTE